MAVKLILNISLLFSILVAPSVLILSLWYRRNMGKAAFVWQKPEMVMMTIIFFIVSLIISIVGVTCFFLYWGYLDSSPIPGLSTENFFNLGISSMLMIGSIGMIYVSMRKLLVQLVMDKGILFNKGFIPVPSSVSMVEWEEIVDYYIVPDYPNVSFTFIVSRPELNFERRSIKVPIYLKDDFQAFLDKKIYASNTVRTNTDVSSHNFYEN